jgi:hypothetical protein
MTRPRLLLICLAGAAAWVATADARGRQQADSPPLDGGSEIRITLTTEGLSRPSPQVLLEAQQQATMIYDAIGVSLLWTREPDLDDEEGPMHLTAVVLSNGRTDQFLRGTDLPPTVLGVAPHLTGRVYLFWDRITHRARENNTLPQIVLARVLAHEIGHHVLPLQGHSDTGIMRSSVDYSAGDPPVFTALQASSIREFLADAYSGD